LQASYGLVDFRAYDGAFGNKLDGNPDFLEWKFKKGEKWGKYTVPDGTTPPWPLSNVLEHAMTLERELLRALKEKFDYTMYGEEQKIDGWI
jgi:hypothetical protein